MANFIALSIYFMQSTKTWSYISQFLYVQKYIYPVNGSCINMIKIISKLNA